jgi:hypothetical protein
MGQINKGVGIMADFTGKSLETSEYNSVME